VYAEHLLPSVKLNFETEGSLVPVAFVFARKDSRTGKRFDPPAAIMIPAHLTNKASKERWVGTIAEVVNETDAAAVVMVSEQWTSSGPLAKAWLEQHGALKGMPGVEEVVSVTEEMPGQYIYWHAKIQRNGRPRLGPWQKTVAKRTDLEGLFVGFLDPKS
jgi:hypothetical protein